MWVRACFVKLLAACKNRMPSRKWDPTTLSVLSVDVATKTEAPDGSGTTVQHELSAYINCVKYYASPWVAKCDREDPLVLLTLPLIIRPLLDVLIDIHGLVCPTCDVNSTCEAISWDIEGPAGLRIARMKHTEKQTIPIDSK